MGEVLFGLLVCTMLVCIVLFVIKINKDGVDDYPVKYKKRK